MEISSDSGFDVMRLIKIPALIALAVTIIRLIGELAGGPRALFNQEAGGGGALVGIVWLIPIFGVYFAIQLKRRGYPPESAGRVIGFALLGLLVAGASLFVVFTLTGDPNVEMSIGATISQQLGFAVASIAGVLVVRKAWPAFFRTLLAYAFASRIPVVIVMFLAMMADWGTHYELGPPGYPEMAFLPKFILIALLPQLTFWVLATIIFGTLFGGIATLFISSTAGAGEAVQSHS